MIPLSSIPKSPGVYQFKNKQGTIIYIGKAKDLHKRISSYFNRNDHPIKTKFLVKNIDNVDYVVVDSEIEALLLENKLIKKYAPRYNINLKDAKTFAYIALSNEKFPRIYSTRKTSSKGKLFGPYTDGSARKEIVKLVVQLFKLRVCHKLPKRACLNYHIGLCTAPCELKVTTEQYQTQVAEAEEFLRKNTKPVLQKLTAEMNKASTERKYEIALEKKKQIAAINHLEQRQKVDLIKRFDQNVVVMLHDQKKAVFVIFSIIRGVISGKSEFHLEYDEEIFSSFLKMYYSQNYIPHEIIINTQLGTEKVSIEGYLTKLQERKVSIITPKIGEKKALVDLALKNAELLLGNAVLSEIKQKLNLPTIPYVIECFDVSNLASQHIVGAMTQWVCGKPNKSQYRKFEIRESRGRQDDFAAMKEMIYRRYKRLKEEGKELPDLIIIDGGLGQIHSALESLRQLGLQIPIIGLAKQEEEIYQPGSELPLKFEQNSPMMLLLRQIRDSVHRFVLSYNIKKREMALRQE